MTTQTHLLILLDRSGSMSSIVNDVIGGVNTLLAEQRDNGLDARVSLVQFDTQDPQDVVAWGVPVAEITDLDARTYQPRGGTPLLDATGLAIGRIMVDQQARQATGLPKEDVIFVTVTDGEENSSREYNLEQVRSLIQGRTEDGWSFVYLSAGLDAYADAERLGIDPGNTQAWKSDSVNSRHAFLSTSRGMSNLREKKRRGQDGGRDDFFETGKDAEDDL